MVSTSKNKNKKRKNDKEGASGSTQKKQQQNQDKEGCFFCHNLGHKKKKCTKYHAWRAKNVIPGNFDDSRFPLKQGKPKSGS